MDKNKVDDKKNDMEKNIKFIYEVINQRVYAEFDALGKKDQKASTLFALDGIILSIIFTLFPRTTYCLSLFCIGISSLFLSLILAFLSYKIAKWRLDPTPDIFLKEYYAKSYKKTVEDLTATLANAYKENKGKMSKKDSRVNWGFICSIIGIFFVFLSLII